MVPLQGRDEIASPVQPIDCKRRCSRQLYSLKKLVVSKREVIQNLRYVYADKQNQRDH